MRNTKIICTIGPSSDSEEMIKNLILNGMDCARINFSHGTLDEQGKKMNRIKKVREELKSPTAILMDTKGPEIRVGTFKDDKKYLLEKGKEFVLDTDLNIPGDEKRVGVTLKTLYKDVKLGTRILCDDGNLEFEVVKVDKTKKRVITKVIDGGLISNRKSLNLPGVQVKMEYLSEADKKDIEFAFRYDIDFIAASFVRSKQDVLDLREYLHSLTNSIYSKDVKIIAKIENQQGVNNIDEILEVADGIMVARGDLGVETPFKYLPLIQKRLIEKANYQGKIVVIATQMLDSMINNPRPTRAEVSDVANAVFDGASCIMLSGETASGNYPVEAVKAMATIAQTAETDSHYQRVIARERVNLTKNIMDATCIAACYAAEYIQAKTIVVVTRTGKTAEFMADFRPNCPVIGLTVSDKAFRQLNLRYGIIPVKKTLLDSLEDLSNSAINAALKSEIAKKGDNIVVVIGSKLLFGHPSDTVRVIEL